ncbi:MAG: monovalent cation/H(+) antiporter subunit G [Pseudomonadota bacterium]
MTDLIAGALVLFGSCFGLIAAIGVFRMPDLYVRMHAASKAGTLGVGSLLLAVAFHGGETSVVARALIAIFFLVLTAPVGAHLLARAAYVSGVPCWSGTKTDELAGHYNLEQRGDEGIDAPEPPNAPAAFAGQTRKS